VKPSGYGEVSYGGADKTIRRTPASSKFGTSMRGAEQSAQPKANTTVKLEQRDVIVANISAAVPILENCLAFDHAARHRQIYRTTF